MSDSVLSFDPNSTSGTDSGIFGLPYSSDEASLILIPVPLEFGCSQGSGCSGAPDRILEQSRYVELCDPELGNVYKRKIAIDNNNYGFSTEVCRIGSNESNVTSKLNNLDVVQRQNFLKVDQAVAAWLTKGKRVGLIGGDHSVSLGSIAAHVDKYPHLGVLQIDAHCDLRPNLDGLKYSHASVMYHAIEECGLYKLTQVGVRAVCEVETQYVNRSDNISVFYDLEMSKQKSSGRSWNEICDDLIETLPQEVYLSLDIDGLQYSSCPHTGTPVPGGLAYNEVIILIKRVVSAGKKIVGFDVVEVGDHDFDALNAAHLLYQICGVTAASVTDTSIDSSPVQDKRCKTRLIDDGVEEVTKKLAYTTMEKCYV